MLKPIAYALPTADVRPTHEQGFTLIELMIAIVLGLLITAAAIQIYVTMTRTRTLQQGVSEITDVSIYGIQQLEQKLRLANLGNPMGGINQTTSYGGIVLAAANLNYTTTPTTPAGFAQLLTSSTGDSAATGTTNLWKGISRTDIGSDQLTLQYQNVTGADMVDCESFTVAANAHVIERYFLRAATNNNGGGGLVLACDAGRVDDSGIMAENSRANPAIPAFGDAGQEIMLNVEQFKVRLGVQNANGNIAYITPNQYKNLSAPSATATNAAKAQSLFQAPIVAVKIGLIARSAHPVVATSTPTSLAVFDTTNTFTDTSSKYVRKTYESTTMLRNARVVTITTTSNAKLVQ